MPSYFRNIPEFEYVTRDSNEQIISEYEPVKNLFKRAKLREDIFRDLEYFTKYQVIGDDRPDNVAYEIYWYTTLDWIILLSNNILNIQTEWPLSQNAFNTYLNQKYGTQDRIFATHHWETTERRDSYGNIIVPKGLEVPQNYSIEYWDEDSSQMIINNNIAKEVTNYDYEVNIENKKRNIFVLKREYLNVVLNDMDDVMFYKKGSTQYINKKMKKAENIRLYQ